MKRACELEFRADQRKGKKWELTWASIRCCCTIIRSLFDGGKRLMAPIFQSGTIITYYNLNLISLAERYKTVLLWDSGNVLYIKLQNVFQLSNRMGGSRWCPNFQFWVNFSFKHFAHSYEQIRCFRRFSSIQHIGSFGHMIYSLRLFPRHRAKCKNIFCTVRDVAKNHGSYFRSLFLLSPNWKMCV